MAQDAFVIHYQVQGITQSVHRASIENMLEKGDTQLSCDNLLSLQAVVNHALYPFDGKQALLERINSSDLYRAWYEMALNANTNMHSPPLVAAASSTLLTSDYLLLKREQALFELKISQDPSQPEHIHVMVKLFKQEKNLAKEELHIHCKCNDKFCVVSLPKVNDIHFQTILLKSSEAGNALLNPDSALYLI